MSEQLLYGYRLIADDGSIGDWSFIDDNTLAFKVEVRLHSGVVYRYNSSYMKSLERWCQDREIRLETCVFQLDSTGTSFFLVGDFIEKQEA